MKSFKYFLFIVFIVSFLTTCKSGLEVFTEETEVDVALNQSPSGISPMITTSLVAREIYTYIYFPMADYDPVTLELAPVLGKEVPSTEIIGEGPHKGKKGYTFEIREEAQWDNGTYITARDYIFTLKAALHPQVNASAWRSLLLFFDDVIEYEENPRKFTVVTESNYFLTKEASCTFEIYPEYVYDKDKVLSKLSVADFLDQEKIASLVESDSLLQNFAREFNSPKFTRKNINGCGPYKFVTWVDDQYVHLEKKENWWGEKVNTNSFLFKAYPRTIRYQFIPDPTTALTALKDGSIDVITKISSANFEDLKESELGEKFNFLTPSLFRYYYLAINNQSPKLGHKEVRKALAHLLDVDQIINNLENGNGTRLVGHFNPVRPYYNKEITPFELNIDIAKDLLQSTGWQDNDEDGILDKNVDGKLVELSLEYAAGRGELGKQVGFILKENAKKVGIDINITSKDFRVIRQELLNHQFEITPMVLGQDLNRDDPYSKWHSDNAVKGKSNWFGYGNAETDALIDTIRYTSNEASRLQAYLDLQEIMHEDAPVIFLYAPKGRIVVSKKFNSVATSKRPGYFVNTFKLAEKTVFSDN